MSTTIFTCLIVMSFNDMDDVEGETETIPDMGDRIPRLRTACSNGDLNAVKQLTEELKNIPGRCDFLEFPRVVLLSAVESGHGSVVEYLLSQGGTVSTMLACKAVTNKDTVVLDAPLRYGWDINEQQSW